MAATLSVATQRVRSATLVWWARTSLWPINAASSRSEMDIVPFGLSEVTRARCTCLGKAMHHTVGGKALVASLLGPNHTPPIPTPLASLAPM